MDIFYLTLKHGFRIVLHTICFLFIHFSMKFMYNVNRTSSDGRIAPAHFLTDCWATLTGKGKQYILIVCNHDTQPRRGGDLAVFNIFHRPRSAEELQGVCLI